MLEFVNRRTDIIAPDMSTDLVNVKQSVLLNPCKKSVKSDIGKQSGKKEALTIDVQRKFLEHIKGNSYENQYRFILHKPLKYRVSLKGDIYYEIRYRNRLAILIEFHKCR